MKLIYLLVFFFNRFTEKKKIYIYNIPYIYIVLFLVLKALYIEGVNLLVHHQCAASTWMMRRQPYCATTHRLIGGEETEWWSQSLGGRDGQRPISEYGQDAGLHPYSFSKDILGFLKTTVSQDLGLTSHLKDGAFLTE